MAAPARREKQSVSGGNGILVQGGRAVLTCTYGKDTDPVVETIDTGSKTRRTIDGPTLCPSGRSGGETDPLAACRRYLVENTSAAGQRYGLVVPTW